MPSSLNDSTVWSTLEQNNYDSAMWSIGSFWFSLMISKALEVLFFFFK